MRSASFLPDGTPPDPGDGECPRCAYGRVSQELAAIFEEISDREQPGSWGYSLYGSPALCDAIDVLAEHAMDHATGRLCWKHATDAETEAVDRESDCERDSHA